MEYAKMITSHDSKNINCTLFPLLYMIAAVKTSGKCVSSSIARLKISSQTRISGKA